MKITITSEEDRALWVGRLKQAEDAMHQLRIGRSVVSVDTPDDKVQFQMTNRHELDRYIKDMRLALGLINSTRPKARGVIFG